MQIFAAAKVVKGKVPELQGAPVTQLAKQRALFHQMLHIIFVSVPMRNGELTKVGILRLHCTFESRRNAPELTRLHNYRLEARGWVDNGANGCPFICR
jgi:hypothetical protein